MNKQQNYRKFCATWYNYLAQEEQSEIIYAKDKREALTIMVAIMKLYAGDRYSDKDIDNFYEITEDIGYTLEDIQNRYRILGKPWKFDNYEFSDHGKKFLEEDEGDNNEE